MSSGGKWMGAQWAILHLTKFISNPSKLFSRSVQNSSVQLGYTCILVEVIWLIKDSNSFWQLSIPPHFQWNQAHQSPSWEYFWRLSQLHNVMREASASCSRDTYLKFFVCPLHFQLVGTFSYLCFFLRPIGPAELHYLIISSHGELMFITELGTQLRSCQAGIFQHSRVTREF